MVLNVSNVNVLQTQWQQIYIYIILNLTCERKLFIIERTWRRTWRRVQEPEKWKELRYLKGKRRRRKVSLIEGRIFTSFKGCLTYRLDYYTIRYRL